MGLVLLPAVAVVLAACGGSNNAEPAAKRFSAATELQDQGRWEEAIREYGEAIRLDPEYPMAHESRGRAYHDLGMYEEAIQDYDQAIRLNPQSSDSYYGRGLAYFNLGDYRQAVQDNDAVTRLDPQNTEAYARRVMAYTMLGMDEEAKQQVALAVELGADRALLEQQVKSLKMVR